MSQSNVQVDAERVQSLVLLRLLVAGKKKPSQQDLARAVAKELASAHATVEAEATVHREVERAVRAGMVTIAEGRVEATERGRAEALERVGLHALPRQAAWVKLKALLALRSLGLTSHATERLDADTIAAHILISRFELPRSTKTLVQAINRLAWRTLGVESDAQIRPVKLQRHLLRELVPADARVKDEIWRRMLAMRSIQARGHSAAELIRALLQYERAAPQAVMPSESLQPFARQPSAGTQSEHVRNDNNPRPAPEPSLADFARTVREAARSPNVSRFHGDRAYIGSIWEYMRDQCLIGSMSLEEFKSKLVSAHRERLLEIARADLVSAMDPTEVRRSEAHYQNATYHFVTLNAGGM